MYNNNTGKYNIHASPLLYYLHISYISFKLITSISSTDVQIRILPVYYARMHVSTHAHTQSMSNKAESVQENSFDPTPNLMISSTVTYIMLNLKTL